MAIKRTKIKSIKKIPNPEKQYVYDIQMKDQNLPYFFGNNILVHNSVYFSAWPEVRDDVEAGKLNWDKETVSMLYDTISEEVSESFPDYLASTFNLPRKNGEIIKSAREIVAETALYIKKKRYACLVYDDDGHRKDIDGSRGKIKAMGLDLRRSDTPDYMQEFLKEILKDVLYEVPEDVVMEKIKNFKDAFRERKPWEKGTPKAVNNLTKYKKALEDSAERLLRERVKEPVHVPGHVRASLNWNHLREIHGDNHATRIVDGHKIVVCYLKGNSEDMTSVAYPIDEPHLPEWFINLPFDEEKMMNGIVDKKIKNLLGVLKWDLSVTTNESRLYDQFFGY